MGAADDTVFAPLPDVERFIVWGRGDVPQWLKDAGAIWAGETELDAAEPGDEDLFDWVIAVNARESDVLIGCIEDPLVTGWRNVDKLVTATCVKAGEWNYRRRDGEPR